MTISRIATATVEQDPANAASYPIPPDWNSAHGYGVSASQARSSESLYGTFDTMYQTMRTDAQNREDTHDALTATVTSISPATGTASGGTVTTLTGTNLRNVTAVTFGGNAGTALSVLSATSVRVTTPAHATGAVTVTVTDNSGVVTKPTFYTYT